MQAVQTGDHVGSGTAGVLPFKMTLVRNRENRPQYVTMVRYEQKWRDAGDGLEALFVVPIRRTMEWVRSPDGTEEALVCTRVTELPFKAIKPQPAHREFIEQWVAHAKAQMSALKKGAKPVKVEVVP